MPQAEVTAMDLDAPWRPACPSLRAASPLEMSLGHYGPHPSGFEGGTGDYSMRIANHSLFLKPTVMYLLHFAGKGAERRGEVGVFF